MKKEIAEKDKFTETIKSEIEKLKEHNSALRNRLEEKIAEVHAPSAGFKEEKEKFLAIIKEKNKIIEELELKQSM